MAVQKLRFVRRRIHNPTGPDSVTMILQERANSKSPWVDVPVEDDFDGCVDGRKGKKDSADAR